MKIFFDMEFTSLSARKASPISLGMISEDRRCFYAEFTDYDGSTVSDFVHRNVLPYLNINREPDERDFIPGYHAGTCDSIASSLEVWFKQFDYVELVADVGHYDMMLLLAILPNSELPSNVCPAYYDLNQDIAIRYDITLKEAFDKSRDDMLYQAYADNLRVQGEAHNALHDARVTRYLYQYIHNLNYDEKYSNRRIDI